MNYFFFILLIFYFSLSANGYGETFQKLCPNSTFEYDGKEVNGFYELSLMITDFFEEILKTKTTLEKNYLLENAGPAIWLNAVLNQISKKENEAFIFDSDKIKEGSYWGKQILNLLEIRLVYREDKVKEGRIYYMLHVPANDKNYVRDDTNCVDGRNLTPFFANKKNEELSPNHGKQQQTKPDDPSIWPYIVLGISIFVVVVGVLFYKFY